MKISDKVDRLDVKDKLNGSTRYIEDMRFENLHFARTLRSEIAKGKIASITFPDDREGIWIVDASDILHKNEVAMILNDMPVFAESEVNYIGEPIALIVAKDKDRIVSFMKEIKVEYVEEEAVLDISDSEAKIFTEQSFSLGDIDSSEYDEVFSQEYESAYQEQLYMEKQGVVGVPDNGGAVVYGSMQCPYYVLNALKHAIDTENVRVIQSPTGGAFGGKEEYPSLIAIQIAVAAMKVGAPVRLVFDRREDILVTTKRHPSKSRIDTYLKNKKIVGMKFDISLDAGPYLGLSDVVLQRSILTMTGCYGFENIEVRGKTIKTNNVFTGAFRGFGAPQSMYALELHMNQLARYLEFDPIDFRKEYFVSRGDKTSTGGIFNEDIYLIEMVEKLKRMTDYNNLDKDKNVGYGFACIPHGGGFTGDGEASHIKAEVHLKKLSNGDVMILVASVEMGQGAITALSKIVASALDYPIERVHYHIPDTKYVPDSGPTVASRTTMVVGGLLYKAALKMKNRLQEKGEVLIKEHFKQPEDLVWNQEELHGNAYLVYSWACVMAKVEMDPVTYEISCSDIYGVYDVGVPIDERMFLGQIHGGVVQGLGYGMLENMESKDGKIQQNSFSSYVIPTICDVPKIHSDWILNRYIDGPFGAKAVGELTLVGVAPAIASAIEDIVRKNINSIPVTPEKIMEVLNED